MFGDTLGMAAVTTTRGRADMCVRAGACLNVRVLARHAAAFDYFDGPIFEGSFSGRLLLLCVCVCMCDPREIEVHQPLALHRLLALSGCRRI